MGGNGGGGGSGLGGGGEGEGGCIFLLALAHVRQSRATANNAPSRGAAAL